MCNIDLKPGNHDFLGRIESHLLEVLQILLRLLGLLDSGDDDDVLDDDCDEYSDK